MIDNVFTNGIDNNISREWLTSALKAEAAEVQFEKKDGTMRVMKCTLSPALLPQIVESEEVPKPERKVSPDTLAVYDLEAKGWRSFRWDSVKSVTFG